MDAKSIIRAEGVCHEKQRLCVKLDNLFSRGYSVQMITGFRTPEGLTQNILIAVVGLEHSFVQTASGPEDTLVSEIKMTCVR